MSIFVNQNYHGLGFINLCFSHGLGYLFLLFYFYFLYFSFFNSALFVWCFVCMDLEGISGSKSNPNPKPDPGKIITFNLWSTQHGKRAESFFHSLTTTRPQPLIYATTAGFSVYLQPTHLNIQPQMHISHWAKLFPKACSADHQMY